MRNYSFGGAIVGNASYVDYLKLQAAEHHQNTLSNIETIQYDASSKLVDIVASQEQMASELGATFQQASGAIANAIDDQTVEVCFRLDRIDSSLMRIESILNWGFSESISLLKCTNEKLDELIILAKTPAQTWSYNQFDIARDAFRQHLYPEALKHLDRAIEGLGDHPGYPLEHRFYLWKGVILLGSNKNYDEDLVDLPKAEHVFLSAARYAKKDFPEEAARAFLSAGWAAYCCGSMKDAEHHTTESLALDPMLAEAKFQLAKINMHERRPDTAFPLLREAVYLDKGYAIKSCADDDFLNYSSEMEEFFEEMKKELHGRADDVIKEAKEVVNNASDWFAGDYASKEYNCATDYLRESINSADTHTLYGYIAATRKASQSINSANDAQEKQKIELHNHIKNNLNDVTKYQNRIRDICLVNAKLEFEDAIKQFKSTTVKLFDIRTYKDYLKSIGVLENFSLALKNAYGAAQKRASRYNQLVSAQGGILGGIIGIPLGGGITFVGMMAIVIFLLLLAIPVGIFEMIFTKSNQYWQFFLAAENFLSSTAIFWIIAGAIIGGIIGYRQGASCILRKFQKKDR